MRRLILTALAVATCTLALASTAAAQDVRVRRNTEVRPRAAERSAEVRARAAERRAEVIQRMIERRPELKQRIEQRAADGRKVRVLLRKQMMQGRLQFRRPAIFDRLDLNKDGRLQRQELRQRRIWRT